MNENSNDEKTVDFKARAKRAWQTRRANQLLRRKRGRPRKSTFGDFEVSLTVYSFEQVRELKAAAVTIDGSNYRLLRKNGNLIPASFFEI